MVRVDKEKFREVLVKEGRSPDKVEEMLEEYPEELDNRLKPAIDNWVKDGTVVDTEFGGLSIKEVMENRQLAFPIAIRELNRLLDENLSEEERGELRETLGTPVHFE